MKKNGRVKKLIRNARYKPVSKELDKRMEALFDSVPAGRERAAYRGFPYGIRWRLAFSGMAAGVVLILGLMWLQQRERLGSSTLAHLQDSSVSPESNDTPDGIPANGIAPLFMADRLILRDAYTATEQGNQIMLKKRIIQGTCENQRL